MIQIHEMLFRGREAELPGDQAVNENCGLASVRIYANKARNGKNK